MARDRPPALLCVATKILMTVAFGMNLACVFLPNHGRALASVALALGVVGTNTEGWRAFNPESEKAREEETNQKRIRAEPEIVSLALYAPVVAVYGVLLDTSSTPLGPNAFYLSYVVQVICFVAYVLWTTWIIYEEKSPRAAAAAPRGEKEKEKGKTSASIRWARITAKFYLPIAAMILCVVTDFLCENALVPIPAYLLYGRAIPHLADVGSAATFIFFFLTGLGLTIWGAVTDGTGVTWGLLGDWAAHAAVYAYGARRK